MDQPEQRFPRNTRVRLRDGVDPGFYGGFSRAGNEGWVRKRKLDRYGFPQILVEWDKDHWAYNGAPDGWTWEGHFETVGDENMSEPTNDNTSRNDAIRELTGSFVKGLFALMGDENVSLDSDEPDSEADETGPGDGVIQWEKKALEAAQAVANSSAYIVIALHQSDESDASQSLILPMIFTDAQSKELSSIAQSQLGHLLASLQDRTLQITLQQASED